jgi:DNA-binding HxlR family transcriptional regulator
LAARKNYGEVPPRVGYSISEKGINVKPLIEEMANFGKKYDNRQAAAN